MKSIQSLNLFRFSNNLYNKSKVLNVLQYLHIALIPCIYAEIKQSISSIAIQYQKTILFIFLLSSFL